MSRVSVGFITIEIKYIVVPYLIFSKGSVALSKQHITKPILS